MHSFKKIIFLFLLATNIIQIASMNPQELATNPMPQNRSWHLLCKNVCGYSPEIYTIFGPEIHCDHKELTFRPNEPIMLYDIFCMQRRLVAIYERLHLFSKALFSKNGNNIFILSDGNLLVIDAQTGNQITNIELASNITDFCLSNNGTQIALCDSSGSILILNAQNFTKIKSLQFPDFKTASIKFSRDDTKLLLTFSDQPFVKIWGIDDSLLVIGNHESKINYATFSDDNSMVLTASNDKTIKIWNAQTGQLISTLQHEYPVSYANMDRLGKIISKDSHDQIWTWIIAKAISTYQENAARSNECTIL